MRKPKLIFRGGNSTYAHVTCTINPDCRALKNVRSSWFVSGDCAGWVNIVILQLPVVQQLQIMDSFRQDEMAPHLVAE